MPNLINPKFISSDMADDQELAALQTLVNGKLKKGTKTIFCIDNGDFATGQAAIDAATTGDVILFGAKNGGWGDISIPAGKRISLKGLQSSRGIQVQIGALTFSPSSGSNILENEIYIDNLFISSTSSTCVTFGGSNLGRMRLNNCYIYSGTSNRVIQLTNTATGSNTNSSVYLYDCVINSGSTTANNIETSTPYVRIYRCSVDGGAISLKINAGTTESDSTSFSLNRVGEIVNISGGSFSCNGSLISNSTTNGSGVLVGTGTFFSSANNIYAIATGTGYCVRGTGYHLHGPTIYNNTALAAGNVRVQNTLVNAPFTTTFTSAS